METVAFRLEPGDLLKESLLGYCVDNEVDAACVVTCVGSLQRAVVRFANQPTGEVIDKKLEIISLVGTLSQHGGHLHIGLSDEAGQVLGGHLLDGSQIYTTAEVVLGIVPGLVFRREEDAKTGYRELRISPRALEGKDEY